MSAAAEALAGQWNVLPAKVVELALTRRPDLEHQEGFMRVGRVSIPRLREVG